MTKTVEELALISKVVAEVMNENASLYFGVSFDDSSRSWIPHVVLDGWTWSQLKKGFESTCMERPFLVDEIEQIFTAYGVRFVHRIPRPTREEVDYEAKWEAARENIDL